MIYINVFNNSVGNVHIADCYNQRIRKVTVSTGIISTIAGTGTGGYSGDNGPATSASFSNPFGVAVDTSGIITTIPTIYCTVCYKVLCALH